MAVPVSAKKKRKKKEHRWTDGSFALHCFFLVFFLVLPHHVTQSFSAWGTLLTVTQEFKLSYKLSQHFSFKCNKAVTPWTAVKSSDWSDITICTSMLCKLLFLRAEPSDGWFISAGNFDASFLFFSLFSNTFYGFNHRSSHSIKKQLRFIIFKPGYLYYNRVWPYLNAFELFSYV